MCPCDIVGLHDFYDCEVLRLTVVYTERGKENDVMLKYTMIGHPFDG